MRLEMEERWQEENFILFNLKGSDVYLIFFNLRFTLIKKCFYTLIKKYFYINM